MATLCDLRVPQSLLYKMTAAEIVAHCVFSPAINYQLSAQLPLRG